MLLEQLSLYVLAVIQGVSEVLPISSTGHLVLLKELFSSQQVNLALAVGLHIGSAIAIFAWFHSEWREVWHNWVKSLEEIKENVARGNFNLKFQVAERYIPYGLALSLLPVAMEGFFLQGQVERVFSETYMVPVFLLLNAGIIMITATRRRGQRRLQDIRWFEYLIIGAIQGIAVLPGISRLGLVLCTGLWLGLNWKEAIRLAFLLAVPVIMGAVLLKSPELISAFESWVSLPSFFVALLLTFIFSFIGLKFFTSKVLERKALAFFAFYCLTISFFSLAFLKFWA